MQISILPNRMSQSIGQFAVVSGNASISSQIWATRKCCCACLLQVPVELNREVSNLSTLFFPFHPDWDHLKLKIKNNYLRTFYFQTLYWRSQYKFEFVEMKLFFNVSLCAVLHYVPSSKVFLLRNFSLRRPTNAEQKQSETRLTSTHNFTDISGEWQQLKQLSWRVSKKAL